MYIYEKFHITHFYQQNDKLNMNIYTVLQESVKHITYKTL